MAIINIYNTLKKEKDDENNILVKFVKSKNKGKQ